MKGNYQDIKKKYCFIRHVIEITGIRILKLSFKLYDETSSPDTPAVLAPSVCFGHYPLNGINMWICSLDVQCCNTSDTPLVPLILQYWLTLCCRLRWVGCGGEGDLSGEGGWCWCHYRCVIARLHSLQDLPTTGSTEHSETLWKISKQPVTIIVFECFRTILVFSILRFSLELCQKCKKNHIFK